jgi:hypothetical protein
MVMSSLTLLTSSASKALTTATENSGALLSASHMPPRNSCKEGKSWCPPSGVETLLAGVATSLRPLVTAGGVLIISLEYTLV